MKLVQEITKAADDYIEIAEKALRPCVCCKKRRESPCTFTSLFGENE